MKRYIIYNSCNFDLISQSGKLLKNVKTNVQAMGSTTLENPGTTAKAIGGNKIAAAEFVLRSAKKARELKNSDNPGAGTDTPGSRQSTELMEKRMMYSRITNFSAQPQPGLNWFQRNPELTKGIATATGAIAGSGMLGGHRIFCGPLITLPLSVATSFLPGPIATVGGAMVGGGLGYMVGDRLSSPPQQRQPVYPAPQYGAYPEVVQSPVAGSPWKRKRR